MASRCLIAPLPPTVATVVFVSGGVFNFSDYRVVTSTLAPRSHKSGPTGVIMSLTEYNSDTIRTLPFEDNSTIELQNITATS